MKDEELEALWSTNAKDMYLLVKVPSPKSPKGAFELIIRRSNGNVILIEDDDLKRRLVERMLAVGVPIVSSSDYRSGLVPPPAGG